MAEDVTVLVIPWAFSPRTLIRGEGRDLLRDMHRPEPVLGPRGSADPGAGVTRWMTPPLLRAGADDCRNRRNHSNASDQETVN